MKNKVNRTLILLAIAAALFTISENYNTPWMPWVRGASAGMALAGIIGVILIIGDEIKARKQ